MTRLTDEEIADLLGDNELRQGDAYMTAHEARSLLTELRERRAADLTDEDREALEWVRHQCKLAEHGHPTRKTKLALSVLSKLTAGKGE